MRRKEAEAKTLVSGLKDIEYRVFKEVMRGSSIREIAEKTGYSFSEVEENLKHILRQFDGSTMTDIIRIGIYAGLFKVDD